MDFLGYTFKFGRKKSEEDVVKQTFSEPSNPDASIEIASTSFGSYALGIDPIDVNTRNVVALISQYREMALQPELDTAIDDIVNEAFGTEEEAFPVNIILDSVELPTSVKKKIQDEFYFVLSLLNFKNESYEIFRRWYVDGRLYYHKVIDNNNPRHGIQELRYIDPRKIVKVRQKRRDRKVSVINGVEVDAKYYEYYIYNPRGINYHNPQGVNIAPEAITFVHSGLYDKTNSVILSYLHKAIKPLNQLRMLEDAAVIYRLSRAPERRIFNVEIGDLPKGKAEQYLKEQMNRFKNRIVYDANTGEVKTNAKFMTVLEDFWFPKRDGKGTTIETLPGGQNLGEMEDVEYFKRKLYKSLNIPVSRLDENNNFSLGRTSEITRDEIKFNKFIIRLRKRFSRLFEDILGTQLILKKIVTREEWNRIRDDIFFDFVKDNMFAELKETDIWSNRLATYRDAKDMIDDGMVSRKWIRRKILHITDDEFDEIKKEIEEERRESEKEADDSNVFDDDEYDPRDRRKPRPKHEKTEDDNVIDMDESLRFSKFPSKSRF